MNIKPIRNDDDVQAAFKRLELVYQAQDGTPESDEMEILVTLIEAYEHKHFPIGMVDPVDAIKFRMEQQGLTQKDLEPFIGTSGRVSEVPISEARARLEEEHAGLVLLDEAETGLRQLLAGQSNPELMSALS